MCYIFQIDGLSASFRKTGIFCVLPACGWRSTLVFCKWGLFTTFSFGTPVLGQHVFYYQGLMSGLKYLFPLGYFENRPGFKAATSYIV